MQVVAEQDWAWMLYEEGPRLFLTVVCGGIAVYEVVLELQASEIEDDRSQGRSFLDRLAAGVSYRPSTFMAGASRTSTPGPT